MREGADVAIVYLHEDEDAGRTRLAVEAEGRQCLTLRGDVKDPEFCRQAIEQVLDRFGHLNILVNNAGFQEHAQSLLDLTPERLNETFHTNIYGYIYMAQACLPHLHAGDAIVNTSSVTALRGAAHLLDYSSTKGAIIAFTYSLAANLAPKGIRVNAVAPGPVWTPLNPADSPAEKNPRVWCRYGLWPPRPAGRTGACLCLPGQPDHRQLHHRHRAPHHGLPRKLI